MIAGLAVFVVVVEVLNRRPALMEGTAVTADVDVVRYVFYAIAIILVLAANVIRGFVIKGTNVTDVRSLAARLNVVNVFTIGLADAPAIMGLVLFLVWRRHTDFYLLGCISLYLMLRHFPRYREWERIASEKLGAHWAGTDTGAR